MIPTLDDLSCEEVTIGVRIDVNSPVSGGELADDARLRAHVDTLTELLDRGARLAVLAHQGRPGGEDFASLAPHAARLDELLDFPIAHTDALCSAGAREAVAGCSPGEALVLENTRFYAEEYMTFEPEQAARTHLIERLAPAFDAYVNDAFAAAHRSQPSLVGFPQVLPGYAGRVLEREVEILGGIEASPTPRVYVLGGAKVSDSIDVARSVLERGLADRVLTTGLLGNVFLLGSGVELGTESAEFVYEQGYFDEIDAAGDLAEAYDEIELPTDVAVDRDGEREEIAVSDLPTDGLAKDVGSETIAGYSLILENAGTVILNGPAGVFEEPAFATGTEELYAAASRAEHSIVGGGDTAAALRRLGISGFDHVSTGGGAALRMLTDEALPAVEALRA
ncbi:phosphoglycerate kinase [Halobacteriales archaeon QS_3_64_16]|nr:MAG: phosphoglycerate kinase [Halobacteriales archaeon QS_3_64_16]